ncbi:MAG: hypothetical protein M9921_04450 [Fimbriimonadaceae bacterium]|nr:hypothetical protein [Fimbriimonadaceae bacterium]
MPATVRPRTERPAKPRIPWFLILALAGSAYVFWVLPTQLEHRPVHVDFVKEPVQP